MKNKGFIITVDSFLGITLLFVLITLSYFFLSQVSLSAWNTVDLRNAVNDTAVVLQKSGALENSVLSSSAEFISSELNFTHGNYCFEVTVENPSDHLPLMHAIKGGCIKSSDSVVAVNKGLIVRDESAVSFYLVRVEGWSS